MRYFDDMTDKYGFNDGGSEPDGARTYRRLYVQCLNAIAELRGSPVRAIAYDRPGCHNTCLIMPVSKAFFNTLQPDDVLTGNVVLPAEGSMWMPGVGGQALLKELAEEIRDNDIDVDSYVDVVTVVSTDFPKLLDDLQAGTLLPPTPSAVAEAPQG
jgi:hypothetical protein